MKRLLNFLFCLLILHSPSFILHSRAYASGPSLSIRPTLFTVHAFPGTSLRSTIYIENKGDEAVDLQISLKPFTASSSENGEVSYSEDFGGADPTIAGKVRILEDEVPVSSTTLSPKQEKQLTLAVDLPADESQSDYYFSILFVSVPPVSSGDLKTTTVSRLSGAVATNVLLLVGEPQNAAGVLKEFSAPLLAETGPVPFTLRIENTGDSLIRPFGHILVKNIFGQLVGNIDIQPQNVLKKSTRHTTTLWQESFILGLYTAELSVSLSPHGPLFSQTIRFIAFPVRAFGAVILILYFIQKTRAGLKKRQSDK